LAYANRKVVLPGYAFIYPLVNSPIRV